MPVAAVTGVAVCRTAVAVCSTGVGAEVVIEPVLVAAVPGVLPVPVAEVTGPAPTWLRCLVWGRCRWLRW